MVFGLLLGYKGGRGDVVPHLVDGQDPTAHQLCLGGDKGWEHQPRTVAQHQRVIDVQCLNVGGYDMEC